MKLSPEINWMINCNAQSYFKFEDTIQCNSRSRIFNQGNLPKKLKYQVIPFFRVNISSYIFYKETSD